MLYDCCSGNVGLCWKSTITRNFYMGCWWHWCGCWPYCTPVFVWI